MRTLTPREREILDLIVRTQGVVSSSERLAHYFGISYYTIRTHKQNIVRKTHSESLLEATLKYMNNEVLLSGEEDGRRSA